MTILNLLIPGGFKALAVLKMNFKISWQTELFAALPAMQF